MEGMHRSDPSMKDAMCYAAYNAEEGWAPSTSFNISGKYNVSNNENLNFMLTGNDAENKEWLFTNGSLQYRENDDQRALSTNALVRYDGVDKAEIEGAASLDNNGGDIMMTLQIGEDEMLHFSGEIRNEEDSDNDCEEAMIATNLRYDNEQVLDMSGNVTWRDSGKEAAMTVTVDGSSSTEEWLHVSGAVSADSQGDEHSLTTHALVRYDGSEKVDMQATGSYDGAGASVNTTLSLDGEDSVRFAGHVRSADVASPPPPTQSPDDDIERRRRRALLEFLEDDTEVEMAAFLVYDNEQVFDMSGNVTWRDSGKEAAMTVTVDGSSSTEEWLHVSGAVSADSQGDEHSLTTHALVRYDGSEKVDMQATGSYDGAGASVNTTLSLDGEDSVRFAGHVRSADVASPPPPGQSPDDDIERRRRRALLEFLDDDTEVEMAAFLVYDNEQVFDMSGNVTWRDSGKEAAMTVTVDGSSSTEEWLHVSGAVSADSQGDEHSLTTHALVRYDGSEKVDMQATGSYDGAGASVNTTLSLDGEDSVRFAGHVRSADVASPPPPGQSPDDDIERRRRRALLEFLDDDTEVEMAAYLVYDNEQVFDMSGNVTWRDSGKEAAMTVTVDGSSSTEEWLHVSGAVSADSQGDEHSLTTHALVRYDGAEKVDMQATGSYDGAGASVNTTLSLDGEDSVRFAAHVRSADVASPPPPGQSPDDDMERRRRRALLEFLDDDTEVEMAAYLVYDNEQVFDMTGNVTWRDSGKEAAMTVTVDGSSSTEEWLHVSGAVSADSQGDEHSLTTHALVRYDGSEKVDMQATGSYDGAGASVNITLSLDGEDSVRFAGHVRSADVASPPPPTQSPDDDIERRRRRALLEFLEDDTEVEMAAFLVYDNEQVFDMTGNVTWRDSGKEAAMTVTVDGSSSTEEWLHVSGAVSADSQGDEHSLTTHALVRYDGSEKVDMQATGSYDGAGASVNTTLSLDGEDSVRFAGHVRSADVASPPPPGQSPDDDIERRRRRALLEFLEDDTEVEMAAYLVYDTEQVFDMTGNVTWRDSGKEAAMTVTVDGSSSTEEWLHVSGAVSADSQGDEHSLTTHALVRYDGSEKVDMQATGSYDGAGASVNTTLSLDGEDSVRFAGHVRSADVASPPPPGQSPDDDIERRRRRALLEFLDDDIEVEMAAFLVYDNEQVFDMSGNVTWRDSGKEAAMTVTVDGSSSTEEWLHVSGAVSADSQGDEHSLTTHALVRYDGSEKVEMQATGSYDGAGASVNTTLSLDGEDSVRFAAHVRSADVASPPPPGQSPDDDIERRRRRALLEFLDDDTEVEMAAYLVYDTEQVFDMSGNLTWRDSGKEAAMTVTVDGSSSTEEWLHVSGAVSADSQGDEHSLTTHALVRYDGAEKVDMQATGSYDGAGASVNTTLSLDGEDSVRFAGHVRSADVASPPPPTQSPDDDIERRRRRALLEFLDDDTEVEMAAFLVYDNEQVFDMTGNVTWRDSGKEAAMTVAVDGSSSTEEWLHVSGAVSADSQGDEHSLTTHALVRYDGSEKVDMQATGSYDGAGASVNTTLSLDGEDSVRFAGHVRSADVASPPPPGQSPDDDIERRRRALLEFLDDDTEVEMAAYLVYDTEQVFDMTGNITWRDSGKEAAMTVTVDGSSSTEEWLHVSGAVSADSQGDEHSLTTHALVRYDGSEKVDMQATGSYDGAGASVNITLSLDGEDSVRFAGHVRSADVASPPPPTQSPDDDIERRRRRALLEFLEDDTEVEMAAFLVYDNEQVFDMSGNVTWRDSGKEAAMTVTVDGSSSTEEWLHVSGAVSADSQGDEHSLTTHALVRYDGSEKVDMQATGSYDGAGASVNTTLSLDGEDSVRFAGHVRSADVASPPPPGQSPDDDIERRRRALLEFLDDDTEVEMAAYLVYDTEQVFDMTGNITWRDSGKEAAMTVTVDGSSSTEEWLHVSGAVSADSQGDEHSLTTHALVRYDGAEKVDMQATGSYDGAGASVNTTLSLDGEDSVRFAGHVRSADVASPPPPGQSPDDDIERRRRALLEFLDDDTEVEMAAFLVYDNEQVFDMSGNVTWRDSGKEAAMTVAVDGSSSTEEWLHVSGAVIADSQGDEHSLTTHALVRYDGSEKVDMQATGSYDGAGASVNTTLSLDGEDSVRFAGHVRSADVASPPPPGQSPDDDIERRRRALLEFLDDDTEVEMAAYLVYDTEQVFDMTGNITWRDSGKEAAMTVTVDGSSSTEEWLHVSGAVSADSQGDEHSLTTHALVRAREERGCCLATPTGSSATSTVITPAFTVSTTVTFTASTTVSTTLTTFTATTTVSTTLATFTVTRTAIAPACL
ncbi:hypothetical protein CYMTET_14046 [Cymbomonas tetramitiformis]|uniref:Uncharacterized protein n=1 Tax=Cymbomonas tetramitiformis TaxID=36881 RepID=A0AAE0LAS2_9CHLO|nr:hypothetical protein CYMTET_14046 [Cymbomonas tetramitiformis]